MYEGIWLYYDTFGKVTGQGEFTAGQGTQRVYFASGQSSQLTHYKNNIKEGDELFYLEDGTISRCVKYRNGIALSGTFSDSLKK